MPILRASQVLLVVKNLPANAGDMGLIRELGRFPWRRAWQPTPVFLPGKSHEQISLAGYSPWDRQESDPTEATEHTHTHMPLKRIRKILQKEEIEKET